MTWDRDKLKQKREGFPGTGRFGWLRLPVMFAFPADLKPDQWSDAVRHLKYTQSFDVSIREITPACCEFELEFRRRYQHNRRRYLYDRYYTTARAQVEIRYEPNLDQSFVSGISLPGWHPLLMLAVFAGMGIHATVFSVFFRQIEPSAPFLLIIPYGVLITPLLVNFGQMFRDRTSLVKVIRQGLSGKAEA